MESTESKTPYLSSKNHLWDNAKSFRNSAGYIVLYVYDPVAKKTLHRMLHIVLWERAHGKRVPPRCCIHHLNGITDDNRVENLLCVPKTMHMRLHRDLKRLSQSLSPVFFNIKRHAIISEHVDQITEHQKRRERWGIHS
ncbi:HNH endonuclease [Geobacter pelophilus]|uniref:HNH endonuclease n=1 Tax=Geoanaerobacter pelophilus TaxID=60036 RepID=A0AAW4L612_9BACT|nr:HNH endonuclease signature motif containing protein [Geoanaerobacter pelophilus]MBT0666436.1 HNH endonuclease [Geoanaerobacter pelophilus]